MSTPQTPAELHDLLHEMFGIGNYDDLTSTDPWFRARMTEISKLRAMLKRRRCSIEEVTVAARYARETGKPIHAAWQVFILVPDALKAQREAVLINGREALRTQLQDAASEALDLGETEWADRLMRAPEATAGTVLDQWRNR